MLYIMLSSLELLPGQSGPSVVSKRSSISLTFGFLVSGAVSVCYNKGLTLGVAQSFSCHDWLVVWLPFVIFPYIGNNHPN